MRRQPRGKTASLIFLWNNWNSFVLFVQMNCCSINCFTGFVLEVFPDYLNFALDLPFLPCVACRMSRCREPLIQFITCKLCISSSKTVCRKGCHVSISCTEYIYYCTYCVQLYLTPDFIHGFYMDIYSPCICMTCAFHTALHSSNTPAGEHLRCGMALLPQVSDDHVENTWGLIM